MLKNSLQTKQCDSYKKIIFFQNKTFLQRQQSVSWCVYIFYPGMSTLFNLSVCVHWVFSATNGNSLTQQFRLFLTDSSASLNGNLSGKGEIGRFCANVLQLAHLEKAIKQYKGCICFSALKYSQTTSRFFPPHEISIFLAIAVLNKINLNNQ